MAPFKDEVVELGVVNEVAVELCEVGRSSWLVVCVVDVAPPYAVWRVGECCGWYTAIGTVRPPWWFLSGVYVVYDCVWSRFSWCVGVCLCRWGTWRWRVGKCSVGSGS